MTQPVWITPVGSLGTIQESIVYRNAVVATDSDPITYRIIAGTLPTGIQFLSNGSLTGIPSPVGSDVISRFTVRATTTSIPARIADRTFSITVTGSNTPAWTTPSGSVGSFYTAEQVNFQFEWSDNDPDDVVAVALVYGQLPGGLTLSSTGLLTGYVQPPVDIAALPGYDISAQDLDPYDFKVTGIQNKNYEFTLEVTDGKTSDLRTFSMFVYNRQTLTADTTQITCDNTFITADETPQMAPFLTNADPSNLGSYRSSNYYAYQFVGEDYDSTQIVYAISVNQGIGLPPGLVLDPTSGWYYGYIPDQGASETTYSFNVVVYQSDYVGDPITCTNTTAGTNVITCNSTTQIQAGQPIVFTGTAFGDVVVSPTQIYYVQEVVSATEFAIATLLEAATPTVLTTASGTMTANLIVASQPYPFSFTILGATDNLVTWITPSDLGSIDNGGISTLQVEAENRGGRALLYRLKSGDFNLLPQGLELLPTGEIIGRVSFNTFSMDLGATTFDQSFAVNRNISSLGTTFDLTFTFTVNAYAPDTQQIIYKVLNIDVIDGGSGYSSINKPTMVFESPPPGATSVTAQVGNVAVVSGAITSVEVLVSGDGYLTVPTITITQGFGGSGANLQAVMAASGSVDAVSAFRTFTVRVLREYNEPYQNLLIRAMPPQNDRDIINSLLDNSTIFPTEWLYRPVDPNFGLANNVTYAHAYGLAPDTLDRYVAALYENHYWKNLVLGPIETAQALDADGNVIYEVVYSKIVDNLVNNDGVSVGKIVNLPYEISDPITQDPITQVYPNSLINMRTQMIDVVGQISSTLPRWMVSKQTNGNVLGYTPAWVIAYTIPGKSSEIAYRISTDFTGNLNQVDFKVDRYILDCELSRHWDYTGEYISGNNPPPGPVGDVVVGPGTWTPQPPTLTTFDFVSSSSQTTFDQNSMQFVDPVDMYDPGEAFDKYLVFPKSNILV
jgi:hypothetical protein